MSQLMLTSYIVLWAVVICLSFLVLLVFRQFGIMYLKTSDGVSRTGLNEGKKIPDLEYKDSLGKSLKISSYQEPVVLLFTSPKCEPCKNLINNLDNYLAEHPKVNIVLFSIDHAEGESVPYLRCPVITLPDREIYQEAFEGEVTPFAFLVDENLKVLSKGIVNEPKAINFLIQTSKKKFLQERISKESAV